MNIADAVNLFVAHSRQLSVALHQEGRKLSEVDLHKLRSQLHVLEIETANLQTYKDLDITEIRLTGPA